MRNYIQPGDNIDVPAPYAVASGGGALIGAALFGVAARDFASGAPGVFRTIGVFDLPKAAGAITAGAKLYWDNTARVLTTTATSNTYVAVAVQAVASAGLTVRARLNGVVV